MKELKHIFSFPFRKKLNGEYLISLGVSVAAALLVGALIMALCGHHPLEGYGAMFRGALSSPRALGDTLAKIAGEKAGIIKTGVPLIFDDGQPEVSTILEGFV